MDIDQPGDAKHFTVLLGARHVARHRERLVGQRLFCRCGSLLSLFSMSPTAFSVSGAIMPRSGVVAVDDGPSSCAPQR